MKFCLVNGVQQDYIDIKSRGLAYGDGLFTTAKIQNGHVQYLTAHIQRLFSGCQKLGITPPNSEELTEQLSLIATKYKLAVLKVMITASSGGRGYARSQSNSHDLIISIHDFPNQYEELANTGIKLGLSVQKLGLNPMLAGLKHLNRLEQVLLRQELANRTEDDLLVTNILDEPIEATSANVFFYIDGKLCTPDVSQSGVNGIMRQVILKHYPQTMVKRYTLDELTHAQVMFVCNCVMGIVPVCNFNGRPLDMEPAISLRQVMLKEIDAYV